MLSGTSRADIEATFTTMGPNIAWLAVRAPIAFEVLFTGLPANGGCLTQTLVFLPRGLGPRMFRAAAILHAVLSDDRRVLDHLRFAPGWTERDEGMRRFAEKVEGMEVW